MNDWAPGARSPLAWRLLRAGLGRAGWFIATLVGAAVLIQVLLHLAPGDPVDLVPNGEEIRAELEAEWGLDQPLPARLGRSLGRAAVGDLGQSLTVQPGRPVAELVWTAGKRSLGLLLPALVLGLGLGLAAAWRTAGRPSLGRHVLVIASVPPAFLAAHLLVLGINEATFSLIQEGTIQRPDWFALPDQASALRTGLAIAVLAVASSSLSELHSAFENAIVRIRDSGYVEAARARGARTWPHVISNLVPAITGTASSRVAFLLGGLVIVEKVLMLNGAGALTWEACLRRDYPLALGLTLAAAAAVASTRLLADLVRIWLDPQSRDLG